MLVCANCNQENPDGARFCMACAAPLGVAEAGREERKVVTVLFADLVGFTSRAERLDPEDVRALLSPYYSRLRTELEQFGGTVEKFIGDAVMALFGAPVAHEDDPERAVRAALGIRDWVLEQEEELQVRIAVTTGEALVALGARVSEGEGMASGDVVNTAARLQSAAPVNGVLVDEATQRATRDSIEYRDAAPVHAKGKEQPIAVWEAVSPRSRFGVDLFDRAAAPLVGREAEAEAVRAALDRARGQRTTQLVTLVGVPGIGKSRLVYELMEAVRASKELHYWRQGRSLPYGAGAAFWALAEMVKAHAGISESDPPEDAERKLVAAVTDAVPEGDAAWIAGHLRPLVGLGGESELGGDRRSEAFAAWRRFFEALAERRPLVLVFEDLQWADEASLDFIDHLVDWSSGVRLLVVCTARPELLERRPGWGGGKRNASTVSLEPLSDDETAVLFAQLLERAVLPAETQQALLLHAGGNPLYAEQYARMVAERVEGESLALPENVQGIIAARLDGLSTEEKALLQDAAVLGKVFWAGALAAGASRWQVEERLHSLERKEFVQRARRSSLEGETEYSFRHVLVRDVAYGQIPRGARADMHRRAAEWIETLGRPDDQAEMLAHHYAAAVELAEAAGRDSTELVEPARRALRAAGERALAVHAHEAARAYFERALGLTATDDAERRWLLLGRGKALHLAGDDERIAALREAGEALVASGDLEAAAHVEAMLAEAAWLTGRRPDTDVHVARACELVEGLPESPVVGRAFAVAARYHALSGRYEQAFDAVDRVLPIADALGSDELRAHALNSRGIARRYSGDPGGLEDIRRSAEIADALNSPDATTAYNNLGVFLQEAGDVTDAAGAWLRSREIATRFGLRSQLRFGYGIQIGNEWLVGNWDGALELADAFIAECEAGSPHYLEASTRMTRADIRISRGDPAGEEDLRRGLELARKLGDPQAMYPALARAARLDLFLGHQQRGRTQARELLDLMAKGLTPMPAYGELSHAAAELGVEEELVELVRKVPPTPWREAALATLNHDFARSVEIYEAIGAATIAARVRLGGSEIDAAEGRPPTPASLEPTLAFYRRVGATAVIRRAESLLAATA